MTGRERVRRMFERRDHDRVPRHDSFWPETIRRWESEGLRGGTDGAYDALGGDMQGLCWFEPEGGQRCSARMRPRAWW